MATVFMVIALVAVLTAIAFWKAIEALEKIEDLDCRVTGVDDYRRMQSGRMVELEARVEKCAMKRTPVKKAVKK
jgi:uncharacterized protein YunC (DUF1805 family)